MRVAVFLVVVGVALAAPQFRPNPRNDIPILVDERNIDDFGNYNFRYETGDGTFHQAQGNPVGDDSYAVQGSYSFITPEGETVQVSYTADEFGFRAESPYLPVGPEIPAHALAQIRAAEEAFARQRADPNFSTRRGNRNNQRGRF